MVREDGALELGDGEVDTMLSGAELVAVDDDRVTRFDGRPGELLGTKAELGEATALGEVDKDEEDNPDSGMTVPVPSPYSWKKLAPPQL